MPSGFRTASKCVLVLSWVLALGCRRGGAPEPGTEFFAIAPDAVTEVTYSSDARKLYAYRWRPEGPFQVFVGRRGAAAEQCAGGEGFARWLRALSRVPVLRELDSKVGAESGEWAEVRVRDASRLEPAEMTLYVPAGAGPVVLAFKDRQYVVGVDAAAVRSLASGCATLGAR